MGGAKKTARELAEMIRERLGSRELCISVRKDQMEYALLGDSSISDKPRGTVQELREKAGLPDKVPELERSLQNQMRKPD